jgi:SWI/SNF-related matrix-associated actin-dependent regulator of chromatin subfamily A3
VYADGVRWLIKRELDPTHPGGILADEMGLGKTVQIITLMLSDQDATRPTLVVCDKSLVKQWLAEIETYAGRTLQVKSLDKNSMFLLGAPFIENMGGQTVIVTTYGQLNQNQVAFNVQWCRVILDEAHKIKNMRSMVHQNCCRLKSDVNWTITGTPITKNRNDMVALLKFVRVFHGSGTTITPEDLRDSSTQFVLRRTFADLTEHNQRLALPPLHVRTYLVDLNTDEKKLYNDLIKYGQFAVAARDAAVDGDDRREMSNFILKILLRLQQSVVSPLVINKEARMDAENALFSQQDSFAPDALPHDSCAMCLESLTEETSCRTECNHFFCKPCITRLWNYTRDSIVECPLCRSAIVPGTLQLPQGSQPVTEPGQDKSSKIRQLESILRECGQEKTLIFTHWKTEMGLIEDVCAELGLVTGSIHGSLSIEERSTIIDAFTRGETQVIICQIMCGACGLNLTSAKHVIFPSLDWSPSQHLQALARAHRIGQVNTVTVHYLVARGTIDEHVLSKQNVKLGEASTFLNDERIMQKMGGDILQNRSDVFDILRLLE